MLKGGNIKANQIKTEVGGNLNIESLQDSATYAEKNSQVGASGMNGAGGGGSFNYAKSSVKLRYEKCLQVWECQRLNRVKDAFLTNGHDDRVKDISLN